MALQGKRVVVTRASLQASSLVSLLQERGAIPIVLPTIKIESPEDLSGLDRAIDDVSQYDWVVFSSTNAVRAVADRMTARGKNILELNACKVTAIGSSTASALASRGVAVEFVPSQFVAEVLVQELVRYGIASTRILLPQALDARGVLAQGLTAAGAHVDRVVAYWTRLDGDQSSARRTFTAYQVDAVTLTSSSAARNLVTLLGDEAGSLLYGVVIASIGPITSQTARELGLAVAVEAVEPTVPALVDALDSVAGSPPARVSGGKFVD